MKTSELQGPALDWAVAKCEGEDTRVFGGVCPGAELYSTDWAQGGPIIEGEGICLSCVDTMAPWDARIYDGESEPCLGEGDTPLIAAMRCYVLSKLGEEVEVPDELA